jgi:hypothetical protein
VIQHIDTALLLLCLTAVSAQYIWSFRQIQEVKAMINNHVSTADVHRSSAQLVSKEVCDVQVKRVEDSVEGVKEQIGELKESMRDEFKEIKSLIREKPKIV